MPALFVSNGAGIANSSTRNEAGSGTTTLKFYNKVDLL